MIGIFLEDPDGRQDKTLEKYILEPPTITIEFEEEDAVYKKSDVTLKIYDPNLSYLKKILDGGWFLRIINPTYFDSYFVYASHDYDYQSKELNVTFFDIRSLLEDSKTIITSDVSDETKEEWIKDEKAVLPVWQIINNANQYGLKPEIDPGLEILDIEFKKWALRYYVLINDYYGEITLSEFISDMARTFRSFYYADGKILKLLKKDFHNWQQKTIELRQILDLKEKTDNDAQYTGLQIEYDYFDTSKKSLEVKTYQTQSQAIYKKIHLKFVSALKRSPIEAQQFALNTIIRDIYRKYAPNFSKDRKQIILKVPGFNYSPFVQYKIDGFEITDFYYPIRVEYNLKDRSSEMVLRKINDVIRRVG